MEADNLLPMRTSTHKPVDTARQVAQVRASADTIPEDQGKPDLVTPDAPRASPVPAAPHVSTPSAAGAFLGRATKTVAAVVIGATLMTGLTGCAVTQVEPLAPQTAQQHVSRFVASDAGWSVRGGEALPANMSRILDHAADSRHSHDGQWAITAKGAFTSAWNTWEVGETVKLLENLEKSRELTTVDKGVANAFLHEMVDIFPEVGPTAHAGMGFTAMHMRDLERVILALDAQVQGR